MNVKHIAMLMAAPAALAATPAMAAPIFTFALTGAVQGTFDIPFADGAKPDEVGADYFLIQNLTGTFGGRSVNIASVTFNTLASKGGLTAELPDGEFLGLLGAQLFTGTTASPTFRTGTFQLTSDIDSAAVTLNITEAVPEPATWGMMVLGFGVIGAAMRRRATTRATVRFA